MRMTLVAAILCLLKGPALAAQDFPPDSLRRAIELQLGDVSWVTFDTSPPPGRRLSYAVLHSDPETKSTQVLWRVPPNFVSSWHWHSTNETNIVIEGTFMIEHVDSSHTSLTPGGFSFMPKRMIHGATSGPTRAIVFSSFDGPFDVNIVPDSVVPRGHHVLRP